MVAMYCPKCGNEMEDVNGTITCVPGKMPLAKAVQDYLTEYFPDHNPRSSDVSLGLELTRWFCPGCQARPILMLDFDRPHSDENLPLIS